MREKWLSVYFLHCATATDWLVSGLFITEFDWAAFGRGLFPNSRF
jgi:hypothetical protein